MTFMRSAVTFLANYVKVQNKCKCVLKFSIRLNLSVRIIKVSTKYDRCVFLAVSYELLNLCFPIALKCATS